MAQSFTSEPHQGAPGAFGLSLEPRILCTNIVQSVFIIERLKDYKSVCSHKIGIVLVKRCVCRNETKLESPCDSSAHKN